MVVLLKYIQLSLCAQLISALCHTSCRIFCFINIKIYKGCGHENYALPWRDILLLPAVPSLSFC